MATGRHARRNAILGTILALLVVFAIFFQWDWFRPLVEARASAALGRKVTIGHLDVELGRHPLVILDHIAVANPPGFPPDSAMATIDRLAFRVRLGQLLTGRINLPELTIDHPVARLEPGPDGKRNWEGLAASGGGAKSSAPPTIGQLTINDGDIRLRDPQFKSDLQLRIHTVPDPRGGPAKVAVDGKGSYAGAPTTIAALLGSLMSLKEEQVKYPVSFRWEIGPTRITLTGTVEDPLHFRGLDGDLEMVGPDLDKLYPLIGIALPPSPPYELKGHVAFADRVVRVTRFHGKLGQSDLNGDLKVDVSGGKPRLEGDLASKQVMIADLAGFVGGTPGKPDAANATSARKAAAQADKNADRSLPTTPISFEKLNAMDARVHYRGERVQADYLPFDNLEAMLDLQNGRLKMQPLSFGVGQGAIVLKLDLDGHVQPAHLQTDVDFRKVDLKRIMQQTKLFQGFGTIGGHANLRSTGDSAATFMANGDGGLTVAMTGGQMDAILVELAGLDLLETLGFATGIKEKKNNTFNIRCMVLDAGLEKGVLSTKTFVFDTTDTNIIGRFKIDFHDESLDGRLEPHAKDVSILTFRTPINIKGTLKHPTIYPDPAQTGLRAAAAVALGIVATPLAALIPTIELGLGKDSDCVQLLANAKSGTTPPAPQPAAPREAPARRDAAPAPAPRGGETAR